ncbi:hypothetical protein ARMGADRAFT_75959 [Armillaria gallica]|uniref:Uncharacterized protein n=1 Tax=Armillaria gallica TaxID=47427 RepID=A0A2H3CBN3_ARMGA|nr:hypothetical protein ARMGADRAFT_75959 [Armillaria gallica]
MTTVFNLLTTVKISSACASISIAKPPRTTSSMSGGIFKLDMYRFQRVGRAVSPVNRPMRDLNSSDVTLLCRPPIPSSTRRSHSVSWFVEGKALVTSTKATYNGLCVRYPARKPFCHSGISLLSTAQVDMRWWIIMACSSSKFRRLWNEAKGKGRRIVSSIRCIA